MQVEVTVQNYLATDRTDLPSSDERQAQSLTVGDIWVESPLDNCISATTWELWFKTWLMAMQPSLSPIQAYEVSLRLTDDREIQSLNAQYRHLDQPTDVLAFAALETDAPQLPELLQEQPLYLGDIVISLPTAKRQAQEQQHSLMRELAWLAAHGLLHLLGWDHPDEASLEIMLNQQTALLQEIGFAMDSS